MGVKAKLSIREASGAVSLVILILFIQTIIFITQPKAIQEQETLCRDSLAYAGQNNLYLERDSLYRKSGSINEQNKKSSVGKLETAKFKFDPNTISIEKLVELGLTHKQAGVILRYREKGGLFKSKEDLKKIYVLPDGFYDKVKDSIVIENSKSIKRYDYTASVIEPLSEGNKNHEANKEEFLIELNQADSTSLLKLPGIGPYYAGKIIAFRENVGGLISASQLLEIKGIDSTRFFMFAHMVFADTLKIAKKELSKVTINDLSNNPYIGSYTARSIVRFREVTGKESITLSMLVLNKVIAPELMKILKYYFN